MAAAMPTDYYAPSYITETPELLAIYWAGGQLTRHVGDFAPEEAVAAWAFEGIAWDHEPRDGKCLHDGEGWPCPTVAAAYERAQEVLADAAPADAQPIAA